MCVFYFRLIRHFGYQRSSRRVQQCERSPRARCTCTYLYTLCVKPGTSKSRVRQWVDVSCIRESGCCCLFIPLFFILLSLQFQTLKTFVTLFSGTSRPTKLKPWYTREQWVDVSCIPESGCCCLFAPLLVHSSFQFSENFSQELWGLEGWNLVHTWTICGCITIGGCIMYTGNHAASIIALYEFSSYSCRFLFAYVNVFRIKCKCLNNFRTSVVFIPLLFSFFSLQFSSIKRFSSEFSRGLWGLEGWTSYKYEQWVDVLCIWKSGCCRLCVLLVLHFSFSPIFKY